MTYIPTDVFATAAPTPSTVSGTLGDLIKYNLVSEGDTLKCTDDLGRTNLWTMGKDYEVFNDAAGLHILNDSGKRRAFVSVKFEAVARAGAPTVPKTSQQGGYLEDVLEHARAGDFVECVDAQSRFFTEGKRYPVEIDAAGRLFIYDDTADKMKDSLSLFVSHNNQYAMPNPTTVSGEPLEDVLTQASAGDVVVCVEAKNNWWTEGKSYTVKRDIGFPFIVDDDGDEAFGSESLFALVGGTVAICDPDATIVSTDDCTPDTWDELATGGKVQAAKKEWTSDTINPAIDTSKKLRDW